MVRIIHATTISLAALFGVLLLWLQRVYTSIPLAPQLTAAPDSFLATSSLIISGLTSPFTVVAVGVVGTLFAIYEHQIKLWALFTGVIVFTVAATSLLKKLTQLPRPEQSLVQLSSYGFPSMHAAVATVGFIAVAWLLYYWRPISHRLLVSLLAIGWIVICLSRMLLGTHSVSDVLAGILLGIAIGTVAISIAPRIFTALNINIRSHR